MRKEFGWFERLPATLAAGQGGAMPNTILLLAANPKYTPQLRLAEEARDIEDGLERVQRSAEFTVRQKWATRPADVRRAMLDLKPRIVHFMGHGAGEDGIAFQDDDGNAKLVSGEALAGFFELFADRLECVVLNACYSEVQARAIARHIPFVVGMSRAISDASSLAFSVAFYDALGAGENVDFAFRLACNAIAWEGTAEELVPVLLTKPGANSSAPAATASAPTAPAAPPIPPAGPSRGAPSSVPAIEADASGTLGIASFGRVTVIQFPPRLSGGARARASSQISSLATDQARLVMDFTGYEYLLSSDLALIVATIAQLKRGRGELALVVSDDRLREIFELTRIKEVVPIYTTVGEAVEALK
jgi:anti-anti-sigma factor